MKRFKNKTYNLKLGEKGFSLVELLVSLGLLTIILSLSINVITTVGNLGSKVNSEINVAQESTYAAERIRRIVRSADSINVGANQLVLNIDDSVVTFRFTEKGASIYSLQEVRNGVSQSVMSSDILVKRSAGVEFFTKVDDNSGNTIGVRITFGAYDENDFNLSYGTIISTQSICRNLLLNQ